MSRITEEQLVLPSLYFMFNSHEQRITTTQLKEDLVNFFNPKGLDAQLAEGRNDTLFTQKVRNLKSHNTFENYDYAKYKKKERGEKSGSFTITETGKNYLKKNIYAIQYLVDNNFDFNDLKQALKKIDSAEKKNKTVDIFEENLIITEGFSQKKQSQIFNRSNILRQKAILHYTVDGRIKCAACNFDFEEFYGEEYGKGFIEIHHKKPIFKFEDKDLEKTISEALENVIPVCSNCHRIFHRKRNKLLSLEEIVNMINRHKTKIKEINL